MTYDDAKECTFQPKISKKFIWFLYSTILKLFKSSLFD